MTRIQFIIIIAIIAIIAVIAVPRAVKISRISKAESFAISIASGFQRYQADTNQECKKIEDLLKNPGISGWMGPYISAKVIRNPWGGTYSVDSKNKKIGIPAGDNAPDKYELGGKEEISFSFEMQ